jgi:hypothetical protein
MLLLTGQRRGRDGVYKPFFDYFSSFPISQRLLQDFKKEAGSLHVLCYPPLRFKNNVLHV